MLDRVTATAADEIPDEALVDPEKLPPCLLGVGWLSTLGKHDLQWAGIPCLDDDDLAQRVGKLAQRGSQLRLPGFVCGAGEVQELRSRLRTERIIVATGVRRGNQPLYDQKRTGTAEKAIKDGADYVITGRIVIDKKSKADRIDAILALHDEIAAAQPSPIAT